MKIVGFLQNRYSRRPMPPRWCDDSELARRIWARMLFTSQTGARLYRHLGAELYDQIEWENSSPKIGSVSSALFPPEPEHIRKVLVRTDPHIVLAFGRPAEAGVTAVLAEIGWLDKLIVAPHPAARPYPGKELDKMRAQIEEKIRSLFG